jgi:hypothetical protein
MKEMLEHLGRAIDYNGYAPDSAGGILLPKKIQRDNAEDFARKFLAALNNIPTEGAENYQAGLWSRRNIEAFIEDCLRD